MKNLVLASALGSLATALAVPNLAGPVHYQLTRPYSFCGAIQLATPLSGGVTLGQAPLDFILTDVIFSGTFMNEGKVTVNGVPVLCVPVTPGGSGTVLPIHMTSGVFIPAGATVAFTAQYGASNSPGTVTLAGYVQ